MGTQVELLVDSERSDDVEHALDAASNEVLRLEALLSRFRPESELSRLNRRGSIDAGPDLLRLAGRALAARERTGGRFDPTVHDAVVAAGYDCSFELITRVPDRGGATSPTPCHGRVEIDQERGIVRLNRGVRLDLGGIAKGYAAECACDILATAGPCMVNVGGDLAVRGLPRDATAWMVGADAGGRAVTLAIPWGGLATSGRDRRRWTRGGVGLHHIIDPATGEPSDGDLLRVTVVAGDAPEAEIAATSLFVLGMDAASEEADILGYPTLLVGLDGSTRYAGGLA